MKTTPPRTVLAAAALSLLATSCAFQARAKTEKVIEVDHVLGSAIRVNSRNGGIEVRTGAPGQKVRIHAKITATGSTMAEANERLDAVDVQCNRELDQALVVEARFPDGPRNSDGVSYVIDVPDAKDAILKTSNGRIVIQGVTGTIDLRTSNGGIDVAGATERVTGRTSNGPVHVAEVSGPVDVHTSNGSVDVVLQKDQKGPLDIHTSNGGVTVVVGAAFEGRMGVRTSNGRVRVINETDAKIVSDVDRNSGTIHFTDDQKISKVHSSNGSITVTVRN